MPGAHPMVAPARVPPARVPVIFRVVIQWSLDVLLGLVGTIASFAGFSMLGAAALSLAMGRVSQAPGWLTEVFLSAAAMGAAFLGGGALLSAITVRSRGALGSETDRAVPLS